MKAIVLYASKYGSTKEISARLAENLSGHGVECCLEDVRNKPNVEGFDLIILGSGIYGHKFLPEIELYINAFTDLYTPVFLFGVAMKTEVINKNGREFGGVKILEKYASQLIDGHVLKMVHGRMDYENLSEEDKAGLDKFYESINLSENQIRERKSFRDLISDKEIEELAEDVLSFAASTA